jgi:membrane-associated protein
VELLSALFDLLLHLDRHLVELIHEHGSWIYPILFLIIFSETGLVVAPFLPGDSLLFVAGAIAASGAMDVGILLPLLMAAAFGGDNTNYWIGRFVGPKVFSRQDSRLLNRKHLDYTHAFYERHGGKTIIFARFMPIVRTFAPFVAGVGTMFYPRFLAYSAAGSVAWIGSFVTGGYYFGNVPLVKQNLVWAILFVIFLSILPGLIQYLRARASR